MEQIVKNADSNLWFDEISNPKEFSSPFNGKEYVVLLVINRKDILYREQKNISEQLIATGCRYAVCFGYECSAWDDSIDSAFIFSDPNLSPPNERFVMTTWHEDESIEDVVEYFRWNTIFEEFVPERFLVLFVGSDPALKTVAWRALDHVFGNRADWSPTATNIKA